MRFKLALLCRCDLLVSIELAAEVVCSTDDVGFRVCCECHLNVLTLLDCWAKLLPLAILAVRRRLLLAVETSISGCGSTERIIRTQVVLGKC